MLELYRPGFWKKAFRRMLEQLRQGKLEQGSAGHHIGILNIIQRLSLIYGQNKKLF